MKREFALVVLMMFWVICPAWTGTLNPSHVADNAVWVAHADLEKIAALPLVSECPFMSGRTPKMAHRKTSSRRRLWIHGAICAV